jgi:hypothetical protein
MKSGGVNQPAKGPVGVLPEESPAVVNVLLGWPLIRRGRLRSTLTAAALPAGRRVSPVLE